MPKPTISAAAGGLSKASRVSVECPVALLAHEAASLYSVIDHLGLQRAILKNDGGDLAMQIQALRHHFHGLEDQATHLVVTSPEGALYQCPLLFSLSDAWGKGLSEYKSKRMLFSLRTFLEGRAAARLDEGLSAYYMKAGANPHFLIAEALGGAAYEQEACA